MDQANETMHTVEHNKVVELLGQLDDRLGELRRHL
jgi:hypothetical protein